MKLGGPARRPVLLAAVVLAGFALMASRAGAAEPITFDLPDATHADSLSVAPDGTLWFVPTRGTEWKGQSRSIVASIAPDGLYTEHAVPGFGTIVRLSVGPDGEIWIAGYEGEYTARWLLEVGRLSATGSLEAVYPVGRGGWIKSLHAAEGAAWFVHQTYAGRGRSTLESISATGALMSVPQQGCNARADAVGPDGSVWLTEVCAKSRHGRRGKSRAFVGRLGPDRTVFRRPLPAEERPSSIAITSDGGAWFGILHKYPRGGYGYWEIGHLDGSGDLTEYGLRPPSVTSSIAAGPEDRAWFTSTLGKGNVRAVNSIGLGGQIGTPICADPTCSLVPSDLTAAPDGSLWYALGRPNLNTGGGGSGIAIDEEIANEPGAVGRLGP